MQLLYIDLFCGAGGTSTGVNSAKINEKECAKVIACVNHDKNAIASHAANHPEALHFTEDIRTLDLLPLMSHVREQKLLNPFALIADSRTLAEHLFRYIENLNPDYIQIENVEEFMAMYGIVDIKMRMFKVSEMKKIMGFPEEYVLIGTQADQKKFIGNAVEVTIARKWCEALCNALKDFDIEKYKSKNKAA